MYKHGSRPFNISIVMSVYNVEDYLQEAVESILTQTIGFKEHVQIVFVNDGSTDKSALLCKTYQESYPDNIVYLEKENGGLSSARNAGIPFAQGELINFFDPDDTLSPNTLEEVYAFYLKNKDLIDFVTIPLFYFEAEEGIHMKYRFMGKKNRIINLEKEYYNFILSSAATFYKHEVFQSHRYNENLITAEDSELNIKLQHENPQFGYVCEHGVTYNYRKRLTGGSNVDKIRQGSDVRAWTGIPIMFQSVFGSRTELHNWEKELIAYEMRSRLRDLRKTYFKTETDYRNLVEQYSYWASKIDDDFILDRSKYLKIKSYQELFLRLKGSSLQTLYSEGKFDISKCNIWLKNAIVENGNLTVEVVFYNYGCDFDLVLRDNKNEIIAEKAKEDFHSPHDMELGEFKLDVTHYRKYRIPLHEGTYSFFFQDITTDTSCSARTIIPCWRPPFMNKGHILAVVRNNYQISLISNSISITVHKTLSIIHGIKSMLELKKRYDVFAKLRPFALKKKRFILIGDRPHKAGDNGLALFEHIMSGNDRALKARTYFVLDKNSPSFKLLKYKKHVVQPWSLKHKLLFLNAKIVASTHTNNEFWLPFDYVGLYYADLLDYKFIWLQHGITKDDISKQANRLNPPIDAITVCSPQEQHEFLRKEYFYSKKHVRNTGFARLDKLENKPANIITISPTWRYYLSGAITADGYHLPRAGFEESLFYKSFLELLTNNALLTALEKCNYTIHFVLHPGMACYETNFKNAESPHVKVLPQKDANYSDIFAESSLLITDYSSTAFDFAYLKKPIIYFQFDETDFFNHHYRKGYFDYRADGFGPVTTTVSELIKEIIDLIQTDFEMPCLYKERVDSFFTYTDKSNCARIVELIKELDK